MIVVPASSAFHRRAMRGMAFPRSFAGWIDACDPGAAPGPAHVRDDVVGVPPLDVVETGAAYIATLDMPGIAKEQLEVSVEGRRVVISTTAAKPDASADTAQASAIDTPRPLHLERKAQRYARTIVLPADLEAGAAQARIENGVLTLTLPKRVASASARITVQ